MFIISECLEYRSLVTQVVDKVQGITLAKEIPLCYFDSAPLIVGGTPAEPGEFPHMVRKLFPNYLQIFVFLILYYIIFVGYTWLP